MSSIVFAFSMNLLLGVGWTAQGLVMSRIAEKGGNINRFYLLAFSTAAVGAWVFLVDWDVFRNALETSRQHVIIWMVVAGVFNSVAQILFVQSMRLGPHGLTWGLMQTAMVIPFMAGIFIWNDAINRIGWAAPVCFLGAVALQVKKKSGNEKPLGSLHWMLSIAAAWAVMGLTQTFMGIPSRWVDWSDDANIRIPIMLTAATCVQCLWLVTRRSDGQWVPKLSFLWAVIYLVSATLMFVSLDAMSKLKMAGIVFPVGVGFCIGLFLLYTRFVRKEKLGFTGGATLALVLIGVACAALAK
jgi:multidrug transporter EmrE-like cation transporter